MGLLLHQFIVLLQLKSVWRNNFSGPGTIILKVNFLCFNGTRNPLLIHGFSPVNARLLTLYGTPFYAITLVQCSLNLVCLVESSPQSGSHPLRCEIFLTLNVIAAGAWRPSRLSILSHRVYTF